MKKLLLTLCISLFCTLAQAQTTPLPESFYGNWITTDGSNKFVYGLHKDVALMDNMIWDYTSVKKKGSAIELNLKTDHQVKTLFVKLSKTGNLLVSSNNKSFTEYNRAFSESKTTNSDWVFSPEKYRNKLYKPGKAILRGYLPDFKPELGFKNMTITIENYTTRETNNTLVTIQPDGRFETTLNLEHPISFQINELRSELLLSPGDTLLLCCNLTTGYDRRSYTGINTSLRTMSNSESADFNNLRPLIKSKISTTNTDYKRLRNFTGKDTAEVINLKKDLLNEIRIIQDSSRLIMSQYELSDYMKDLIVTDFIADKFCFLLDAIDRYKQTHESYELQPSGARRVFPNKEFVPVKNYFDFIRDFQSSILDNPLIICTTKGSSPINKFEFCEIVWNPNIVNDYEKEKRKKIINYALQKEPQPNEVTALAESFANPNTRFFNNPQAEQLSKLFNKYAHVFPYDPLTEANVAAISFNKLRSYGLDKSILYDYALSGDVISTLRLSRDTLTDEKLLEKITAALLYIKTPSIGGNLIQFYTNHVQVKKTDNNSDKEADAIFDRIIAPYKGNVLVIDFWSTGCGPCRVEMMADRAKVKRLKDHRIKFLYITDETQSPIDGYNYFLKENNIKGEQIRISHDDWSHLSVKFNIYGIPHHLIVGKNGEIIKNKAENIDDSELLKLEKE